MAPSQALATQSTTTNAEMVKVDEALLHDYLKSMGLAQKLTVPETSQFIQIAKAYQLNPFKREIYATKYGENSSTFSIIVGYETYLKRAERSGQLNGWKVDFADYEGGELSATITIWRKDWSHPFEWEVFYTEQVQKTKEGKVTKFWEKKRQQLRKVAISQGMRLAFPDENGGLPYTADEMGGGVEDTSYETVPNQQALNEGKVQSDSTPKAGKKQLAEETKAALTEAVGEWHKRLGVMLNDPDRNTNHKSYNGAGKALFSIQNMPETERLKLLDGLKNEAVMHNVEFDEAAGLFFTPEYEEITDEEGTQALANHG